MKSRRYKDQELLFMKHDWGGVVRNNISIMCDQISKFELSQFKEDLDEQAKKISTKHTVFVPELIEENIEVARIEIKVDVSRGRSMESALYGRASTDSRNGIEINVPIKGDTGMFRVQPNRFTSSPPRAFIGHDSLTLFIIPRSEDPNQVRGEIDKEIDDIKQYLAWLSECHNGLEDRMLNEAKQALSRRKSELDAADDLVNNLGFKVRD